MFPVYRLTFAKKNQTNKNSKLKNVTKSSDVPNLSNSKDWIREIWTPISLCIPEHSMQVKMPKLVDSHVGSVGLKNKIFNQSPRKGFQWW